MKKRVLSVQRTYIFSAIASLGVASHGLAASGSWVTNGSGNWSDAANWSSNPTVPGTAAGDVISLTNNVTVDTTITINTTPRTAGILNIGDSNGSNLVALVATGGGYLTMDNGGAQAQINLLSTSPNANSNIITAPLRVTTGGLKIANSAGVNRVINAAISTTTAGNKTITVTGNTASDGVSLSGVISDGGVGNQLSILVDSPANVTLSGNSTFGGGVTLRNGSITVGNNNALGTGVTTLGDASTTAMITLASNSARTINNDILVSSAASSPIVLQMREISATANTFELAGDINLQRGMDLRFFGSVNDTIRLSGDISGTGALNLNTTITNSNTGNNTFALSGSSSFSGGVTTGMHRLSIQSAAALGSGTLTLNNNLNAAGKAVEIDNGSGASLTLTTNNAQAWRSNFTFVGTNDLNMGTGAVTLFGGNRTVTITAGTLVIGGAIGDGGAGYGLIKDGAGILALNGASSYTGDTEVNAGTLRGIGSILGNLFVYNGATLEAGNSIGTFTAGGVADLSDGGTFKFELNSTTGQADLLVANGVTLDGVAQFTITDLGSGVWTGGDILVINNTSLSGISGTFAGIAEGATVTVGINSFTATYLGGTGNDFVLQAVPEPGAWMLLTFGLCAVTLGRRKLVR